ncbi:hypothetical protein R1CP_39470 (plasmid) [Rhodococcus opacus]|uniref:Uncharacterized protein n=1 Tax=Rhodococcus opacus TaxID=37919 RepID=A0A1B1KIQ3_RHOOP|nr:hypothetical protein [Rhodococcus opacus]ANS32477.1 hypothetical protein R1CP_39470 [Rhodococcus opacus]
MPKDQPEGAFDSTVSHAVPDGDSDSRIPQTPAAGAAKHLQFSARVDPELLRQVKIEVATRGTTMQAATAEAFRLWLSSK